VEVPSQFFYLLVRIVKEMKVVLLSGGTGTPKLLQGFMQILDHKEITVIVNTAEDLWLPHGYFSPDVDTVIYTLAGIINEDTWYGIKGDSFNTHAQLLNLGFNEFLNIGDRDRATHIVRGKLLKEGKTLEEATREIASSYGVRAKVLPMSNNKIETVIVTSNGDLNLQEYLILNRTEPEVKNIYYRNIERSSACKSCIDAVKKADLVVIGPSNPISSIGPIISLPDLKNVLMGNREKIVAISPIIGLKPVSGPADKLMKALGLPPTPEGVAIYYRDIISKFVVHSTDETSGVEGLGIKAYRTNIIMKSSEDKRKLAEFVLSIGG